MSQKRKRVPPAPDEAPPSELAPAALVVAPPAPVAPMSRLTLTPNPILHADGRVIADLERQMDRRPHLVNDQRFLRKTTKAEFIDATQTRAAIDTLMRIPAADEAMHLVVAGNFSLLHLLPAALAIAGSNLASFHVVTLSFSAKNIALLCELVDAGTIDRVRLLCSHYFAGTSPTEFDLAKAEFARRRERMDFLSVRTHAKLLLFRFADGRTLSVESSANARSCRNIENVTLFGSPELYAFHRTWIDDLFNRAAAESPKEWKDDDDQPVDQD